MISCRKFLCLECKMILVETKIVAFVTRERNITPHHTKQGYTTRYTTPDHILNHIKISSISISSIMKCQHAEIRLLSLSLSLLYLTELTNWESVSPAIVFCKNTGKCCRMMYFTRDTSSVCTQYFLVERTKSCKQYIQIFLEFFKKS